jgi:uncharacterized protein
MQPLRDAAAQYAPLVLALGGLVTGSAFGAIVFRTNYCAMGALSDMHSFGDHRRFRAWILAATTALMGAQLLQLADVVALDRSMYLQPVLNWFGNIAGGLIFGFGMVFAGGCPSRNLSRAGGGDLRALVVLIILGLFAYMTSAGIFGPLRVGLEQLTSFATGVETQGLGDILSGLTGLARRTAAIVCTVVLTAAAIAYCFLDAHFRSSLQHVASGLGVGMTVVAGWAVTGLAFDEMAARPLAPISLTYVRPAGETLQWLMFATATPLPSFGVTSVFGALLGAFAMALAMGRFRMSTFSDTNDTVRNMLGAALMGVGGVMALGCTVGQAVTGVSTLAVGSFLTFAAIVVGGRHGLGVLERMTMAD